MKTASLAITLAFLAAPALVAPANAGEGQGDPFALTTGGKTTTTWTAGKIGSSQNPFPYSAAASSMQWKAGPVGSSQNPFPYTASGTTYSMAPEADTGPARQMQAAHAPMRFAPAQSVVR
ncbi:MAG TPA: hypothetical protein VGC15_12080 [Acetobacteraceae bacterium]